MADDHQERLALLQRALEAAKDGLPEQMLEALLESGILAGIHRKIARNYNRFSPEDVDHILTKTVENFLTAARTGKKILRPGPWLFEVASHNAYDYNEALGLNRHDQRVDIDSQPADEDPYDARMTRIRRAVIIARDLLPKIGEATIQGVMAFVLEAIEIGEPVGPPEVAEALGLQQETAKRLINRGFERLDREARVLGIDFDAHDLETDEVLRNQ